MGNGAGTCRRMAAYAAYIDRIIGWAVLVVSTRVLSMPGALIGIACLGGGSIFGLNRLFYLRTTARG